MWVCVRVCERHRFFSILLNIDSGIHTRAQIHKRQMVKKSSYTLSTVNISPPSPIQFNGRTVVGLWCFRIFMPFCLLLIYFLCSLHLCIEIQTPFSFRLSLERLLLLLLFSFSIFFVLLFCDCIVLLIPLVCTAHSISIYGHVKSDVWNLLFCKTGCDDCETHRQP